MQLDVRHGHNSGSGVVRSGQRSGRIDRSSGLVGSIRSVGYVGSDKWAGQAGQAGEQVSGLAVGGWAGEGRRGRRVPCDTSRQVTVHAHQSVHARALQLDE